MKRAATALSAFSSSLPAIAIVSLLTISYALSFATLIFGPAPQDTQVHGLFLVLASVVILGGIGTVLTKQAHVLVTLEGTPLVVLAGGTASLAAALHNAPPETIGATILAFVILTSAVTGLVMLLLGQFRGGAMARFVPLQVVAGITAASGVSLITGGTTVALGSPATLAAILEGWPHLAITLVLVLTMVVVIRLAPGRAALSLLLLGFIFLHHVGFALLGTTLSHQHDTLWLLPTPAHLRFELPWSAALFANIDWPILEQQVPTALAVAIIACLSTLMNFSSLELMTGQETDVDRDMRAVGIATLVSALCGGLPGSISQSRSALLVTPRGVWRATTLVCVMAAGVLPMLLPGAIGLVPRPVLGAMLIYVGLGLIDAWLLQIRRRLTRLEWLTVPGIIAVTIWLGLPAAVFAGMALGCITFAVMYSLGTPIRAMYRGDVAHSNIFRSQYERDALMARAAATLVIYLQGFLFFGTANRLLENIRRELARQPTLRHIVLDGSAIDGLDGSAIVSIERLAQITADHRVSLTFAALPSRARARLAASLPAGLLLAATLDEALERCEEDLLADISPIDPPSLRSILAEHFGAPAQTEAFLASLEITDVPAGTTVMRQSDASDDLVFIEHGRANILLAAPGAEPVRIGQYGPGTMVGEIGFLRGTPRTATVQTETECRLWIFSRAALTRLLQDHPNAAFALQRFVLSRLTERLVDQNRLIHALLRDTRSPASDARR